MAVDEAIILAGGRGTRLQSIVDDVPKPLAPVAGRPFLAWVLDHLQASGMRNVVLATGYMSERIEDFAGSAWGDMSLRYSVEKKPLGTGGAVRQALPHLRGNAAHILNGDTFLRYMPNDLEAATFKAGAAIGIALAGVDDISRYGAVVMRDGLISDFLEKGGQGSGLINAGCYFFTGDAFGALPDEDTFSLETDVLVPQAAKGKVAGYSETAGFIDIGVPQDYVRAQSLFGG